MELFFCCAKRDREEDPQGVDGEGKDDPVQLLERDGKAGAHGETKATDSGDANGSDQKTQQKEKRQQSLLQSLGLLCGCDPDQAAQNRGVPSQAPAPQTATPGPAKEQVENGAKSVKFAEAKSPEKEPEPVKVPVVVPEPKVEPPPSPPKEPEQPPSVPEPAAEPSPEAATEAKPETQENKPDTKEEALAAAPEPVATLDCSAPNDSPAKDAAAATEPAGKAEAVDSARKEAKA